jgi:E3 ubiquitin-protein ligase BRE1
MHGYKRERNSLEAQLVEIRKKIVDHDNHIRVIDAWWLQVGQTPKLNLKEIANQLQLLDEITLLSNHGIPDSHAEGTVLQPLFFDSY